MVMPPSYALSLPAQPIPDLLIHLGVSASLAQVTDSSGILTERKNQLPEFILIEDAHTIASAQKVISEIISQLNSSQTINHLYLEGGDGFANFNLIKNRNYREARDQTLALLLDQGLITGAGLSTMLSTEEWSLEGMEDTVAYEKDRQYALAWHKQKESFQNNIRDYEQELYQKAESSWDADQLSWLQASSEMIAKGPSFLAETKSLDILKSWMKHSKINQYPLLDNLFRLIPLKEKVQQEIYQQELQDIQQRFNQVEAPQNYVEKESSDTLDLYRKLGPLKQVLYPQHRIKDEIYRREERLGPELWSSLINLIEHIDLSLFPSQTDLTLVRDFRALRNLKALGDLELDPASFKSLRLPSVQEAPQLRKDCIRAIRSYIYAYQRERHWFKRFDQRTRTNGLKIVVAGGFHSARLTRKWRERGDSYLVLRPRFVIPHDEVSRELYWQRLQGNNDWIASAKEISQKAYLNKNQSTLIPTNSDRMPPLRELDPFFIQGLAKMIERVKNGESPEQAALSLQQPKVSSMIEQFKKSLTERSRTEPSPHTRVFAANMTNVLHEISFGPLSIGQRVAASLGDLDWEKTVFHRTEMLPTALTDAVASILAQQAIGSDPTDDLQTIIELEISRLDDFERELKGDPVLSYPKLRQYVSHLIDFLHENTLLIEMHRDKVLTLINRVEQSAKRVEKAMKRFNPEQVELAEQLTELREKQASIRGRLRQLRGLSNALPADVKRVKIEFLGDITSLVSMDSENLLLFNSNGHLALSDDQGSLKRLFMTRPEAEDEADRLGLFAGVSRRIIRRLPFSLLGKDVLRRAGGHQILLIGRAEYTLSLLDLNTGKITRVLTGMHEPESSTKLGKELKLMGKDGEIINVRGLIHGKRMHDAVITKSGRMYVSVDEDLVMVFEGFGHELVEVWRERDGSKATALKSFEESMQRMGVSVKWMKELAPASQWLKRMVVRPDGVLVGIRPNYNMLAEIDPQTGDFIKVYLGSSRAFSDEVKEMQDTLGIEMVASDAMVDATDVAAFPDNAVAVSNLKTGTVFEMNPDGKIRRLFATNKGMRHLRENRSYYEEQGTEIVELGDLLSEPSALSILPNGHLRILDLQRNVILEFSDSYLVAVYEGNKGLSDEANADFNRQRDLLVKAASFAGDSEQEKRQIQVLTRNLEALAEQISRLEEKFAGSLGEGPSMLPVLSWIQRSEKDRVQDASSRLLSSLMTQVGGAQDLSSVLGNEYPVLAELKRGLQLVEDPGPGTALRLLKDYFDDAQPKLVIIEAPAGLEDFGMMLEDGSVLRRAAIAYLTSDPGKAAIYITASALRNSTPGEQAVLVAKAILESLADDLLEDEKNPWWQDYLWQLDQSRIAPNLGKLLLESADTKRRLLEASQRRDWEAYDALLVEWDALLVKLSPMTASLSTFTMQKIFEQLVEEHRLPHYLLSNPREVEALSATPFSEKNKKLIEQIVDELLRDVLPDKSQHSHWRSRILADVIPAGRSSLLPASQKYFDNREIPQAKVPLIIFQAITQEIPTLQWALGFFDQIQKKIHLLDMSNPLRLRYVLKHELMHYLSFHKVLPMRVHWEFTPTAVQVTELIEQVGEDLWPVYARDFSPVALRLYQKGREMARGGKAFFLFDAATKDQTGFAGKNFLHYMEAEVRSIYEQSNQPLALLESEDRMQREVGILLAGIMKENASKAGPLRTLADFFAHLDEIYGRPDRQDQRWVDQTLKPQMTTFAQWVTDKRDVQLKPQAEVVQGWQFLERSEQRGDQLYVPRDLYPRKKAGQQATSQRYRETEDRAYGHLFLSLYRFKYGVYQKGSSQLKDEKEERLFQALVEAMEIPQLVIKGLLEQRELIDAGGFSVATRADQWVRQALQERFAVRDDLVTKARLSAYPLHLQYLNSLLYRWVNNQADPGDSRLQSERVREAINQTQADWENLLFINPDTMPDPSQLLSALKEKIWPTYFQLYQEAKQSMVEQLRDKEMPRFEGGKIPSDVESAIDLMADEMMDQMLGEMGQAMKEGPSDEEKGEGTRQAGSSSTMSASSRSRVKHHKREAGASEMDHMIEEMQRQLEKMRQELKDIESQTSSASAGVGKVDKRAGELEQDAASGSAMPQTDKTQAMQEEAQALRELAEGLRDGTADLAQHTSEAAHNWREQQNEKDQTSEQTAQAGEQASSSLDQLEELAKRMAAEAQGLESSLADLEQMAGQMATSASEGQAPGKTQAEAREMRSKAGQSQSSIQDLATERDRAEAQLRDLVQSMQEYQDMMGGQSSSQTGGKSGGQPSKGDQGPPAPSRGKGLGGEDYKNTEGMGLERMLEAMRAKGLFDAKDGELFEVDDPVELTEPIELDDDDPPTEGDLIETLRDELNDQIHALRVGFLKLLKLEDLHLFEGGFTSGPRMSNVVKAFLGDGGFVRRTDMVPQTYRISFVVDVSKSMKEDMRTEYARNALLMLLDVILSLKDALAETDVNIEFEIYAFGFDSFDAVTFEKSREYRYQDLTDLLEKVLPKVNAWNYNQGTSDLAAIEAMADRSLQGADHGTRYMGFFIGDSVGYALESMREAIKKAEEAGAIFRILPLGISNETLASMRHYLDERVLDVVGVMDTMGEAIMEQLLDDLAPGGQSSFVGSSLGDASSDESSAEANDDLDLEPYPGADPQFQFYLERQGDREYFVHLKDPDDPDDYGFRIERMPGGSEVPPFKIPYTPDNLRYLREIYEGLYPVQEQQYRSLSADGKTFLVPGAEDHFEVFHKDDADYELHVSGYPEIAEWTPVKGQEEILLASGTPQFRIKIIDQFRHVEVKRGEVWMPVIKISADGPLPRFIREVHPGEIVMMFGAGANMTVAAFVEGEGDFTQLYRLGKDPRDQLDAFKVLLLEGEDGTAKGELMKSFLALANQEMGFMSCNAGMCKEDFFFYRTLIKDGDDIVSTEQFSPLAYGLRMGRVVLLDEVNKTSLSVLKQLQTHLEEKTYTWKVSVRGSDGRFTYRYVSLPAHPRARVVMLANPGGGNYIVNEFDGPLKDRTERLYITYQDPEWELKILEHYALEGLKLSQEQRIILIQNFKKMIYASVNLRLKHKGYSEHQIQQIREDWSLYSDPIKRADFPPAGKPMRLLRPPSPRILINIARTMANFPTYAEHRPLQLIRRYYNFHAEDVNQATQRIAEREFEQLFKDTVDMEDQDVLPELQEMNVTYTEDSIVVKPVSFVGDVKVWRDGSEVMGNREIAWEPVEVRIHPDAPTEMTALLSSFLAIPSNARFFYEFLQEKMVDQLTRRGSDDIFVGEPGMGKSYASRVLQETLSGPDILSITYGRQSEISDITVQLDLHGETYWLEQALVLGMGNQESLSAQDFGKLVRHEEPNQANPKLLAALNDVIQNRVITLPNLERRYAASGFGNIMTLNPPGGSADVNPMSWEFIGRNRTWLFDAVPLREEADLLFRKSGGLVNPNFIGQLKRMGPDIYEWQGLVAVVQSLRQIKKDEPKIFDQAITPRGLIPFIAALPQIMSQRESSEAYDEQIFRLFVRKLNIDRKHYKLVKSVFEANQMFNVNRNAVATFLEGQPLILEGFELLTKVKTGKDQIDMTLRILQLSEKASNLEEQLKQLLESLKAEGAQFSDMPYSKRIQVVDLYVTVYKILNLVLEKRQHQTAVQKRMREIITWTERFFREHDWPEQVLARPINATYQKKWRVMAEVNSSSLHLLDGTTFFDWDETLAMILLFHKDPNFDLSTRLQRLEAQLTDALDQLNGKPAKPVHRHLPHFAKLRLVSESLEAAGHIITDSTLKTQFKSLRKRILSQQSVYKYPVLLRDERDSLPAGLGGLNQVRLRGLSGRSGDLSLSLYQKGLQEIAGKKVELALKRYYYFLEAAFFQDYELGLEDELVKAVQLLDSFHARIVAVLKARIDIGRLEAIRDQLNSDVSGKRGSSLGEYGEVKSAFHSLDLESSTDALLENVQSFSESVLVLIREDMLTDKRFDAFEWQYFLANPRNQVWVEWTHTVDREARMQQLEQAGLSWKSTRQYRPFIGNLVGQASRQARAGESDGRRIVWLSEDAALHESEHLVLNAAHLKYPLLIAHYLAQIAGRLSQDELGILSRFGGQFVASMPQVMAEWISAKLVTARSLAASA